MSELNPLDVVGVEPEYQPENPLDVVGVEPEPEPSWTERIRAKMRDIELVQPVQDAVMENVVKPFARGTLRTRVLSNIATNDFEEAADLNRRMDDWAASPESQAGMQRISQAPTMGAAAMEYARNPGLAVQVASESLPLSGASLAAGAAGAVGGGVVGGPVGAVVGSMGGMAAGSFTTEYLATLDEQAAATGIDVKDPAQLAGLFADPAFMAKARERGVKRGIPIAAFDALSMGIAGRLFRTVKGAPGMGGVAGTVAGTGAEVAGQAGAGMGGEAGAQLLADGGIVSPGDIVSEGIGEIVPGAVEAAINVGTGVVRRRPGGPRGAAGGPQPTPDGDGRVDLDVVQEAYQPPRQGISGPGQPKYADEGQPPYPKDATPEERDWFDYMWARTNGRDAPRPDGSAETGFDARQGRGPKGPPPGGAGTGPQPGTPPPAGPSGAGGPLEVVSVEPDADFTESTGAGQLPSPRGVLPAAPPAPPARPAPVVSPAAQTDAPEPTEAGDPIAQLLDRYDEGDISDVGDLVASLDEIEQLPEEVQTALDAYRDSMQEDYDEWGGRGDWDDYENALVDALRKHGQAAKPAAEKPEAVIEKAATGDDEAYKRIATMLSSSGTPAAEAEPYLRALFPEYVGGDTPPHGNAFGAAIWSIVNEGADVGMIPTGELSKRLREAKATMDYERERSKAPAERPIEDTALDAAHGKAGAVEELKSRVAATQQRITGLELKLRGLDQEISDQARESVNQEVRPADRDRSYYRETVQARREAIAWERRKEREAIETELEAGRKELLDAESMFKGATSPGRLTRRGVVTKSADGKMRHRERQHETLLDRQSGEEIGTFLFRAKKLHFLFEPNKKLPKDTRAAIVERFRGPVVDATLQERADQIVTFVREYEAGRKDRERTIEGQVTGKTETTKPMRDELPAPKASRYTQAEQAKLDELRAEAERLHNNGAPWAQAKAASDKAEAYWESLVAKYPRPLPTATDQNQATVEQAARELVAYIKSQPKGVTPLELERHFKPLQDEAENWWEALDRIEGGAYPEIETGLRGRKITLFDASRKPADVIIAADIPEQGEGAPFPRPPNPEPGPKMRAKRQAESIENARPALPTHAEVRKLSDAELERLLAEAEETSDRTGLDVRYRSEIIRRRNVAELKATIAAASAKPKKAEREQLTEARESLKRLEMLPPEVTYRFPLTLDDGSEIIVDFELNDSTVSFEITGSSQVGFEFHNLPEEYSETGYSSHMGTAQVDAIPTLEEVKQQAKEIIEKRRDKKAPAKGAAAEFAAKKKAAPATTVIPKSRSKRRALICAMCSGTKDAAEGKISAEERYGPGAVVSSMAKIPEHLRPDILFLSAEFGLIGHDTPIPHYEKKLTKAEADKLIKRKSARDKFVATVRDYDGGKVLIAAGGEYRRVFEAWVEAGTSEFRGIDIEFAPAEVGLMRGAIKAFAIETQPSQAHKAFAEAKARKGEVRKEELLPVAKREPLRQHAKALADELVEGGGLSYKKDSQGRITGRTKSVNPEWAQELLESEGVSVARVKEVAAKLVAGEKLGVVDIRVANELLRVAQADRAGQVTGGGFVVRRADAIDARYGALFDELALALSRDDKAAAERIRAKLDWFERRHAKHFGYDNASGSHMVESEVAPAWEGEKRVLKRSHVDLLPAEKKALAEFLKGRKDRARVLKMLEQHRGTPWANQAIEGMFVRQAAIELMAGRQPAFQTALDSNTVSTARSMLARGPEGLWQSLSYSGFLSEAGKPVNNVSSSFVNCSPSKDCAKYCYATGGNYRFSGSIVKAELVTLAIESDPGRAAKEIAREYKGTLEFHQNKALRLFDKGDMGEGWVELINELNRAGVRVQVFSRRPELLRQISDKNVRMLSIDESNLKMADENTDLSVAFIYSHKDQVPALAKLHARGQVQVVLPIKQGQAVLTKDNVLELRKEVKGIAPYICPIDAGYKSLQSRGNPTGWNCTKCDAKGGIGCFHGAPTKGIMSELYPPADPAAHLHTIRGLLNDYLNAGTNDQADAAAGSVRAGQSEGLVTQIDSLLQRLLAEHERRGAQGRGQADPRSDGRADDGDGEGTLRADVETPRWYFSPLERAVRAAKLTKGTAEQWLGYLKNQPGVKAEEIEDIYLDAWMRSLDARGIKIEKEILLDEIAIRDLNVSETVLVSHTSHPYSEDRERLAIELLERNGIYVHQHPMDGEGEIEFRDENRLLVDPDESFTEVDEENQRIREAMEIVRHGGIAAAQFEEYTLRGGKDYFEVLIQVPELPIERERRAQVGDVRKQVAEIRKKIFGDYESLIKEADARMLGLMMGTSDDTALPPGYRIDEELVGEDKVLSLRREGSMGSVAIAFIDSAESRKDAERKLPREAWEHRRGWLEAERGYAVDAALDEAGINLGSAEQPIQSTGGHFGKRGANTIVHVRAKERLARDGKRVLAIEEFQNDNRKEAKRAGGYRRNPMAMDADAAYARRKKTLNVLLEALAKDDNLGYDSASQAIAVLEDLADDKGIRNWEVSDDTYAAAVAHRRATDAYREARDTAARPPDVPFKKSYNRLAMRRMLRWAAEHGFDYVAWTPGVVQGLRYNALTYVQEVYLTELANGQIAVNVLPKDALDAQDSKRLGSFSRDKLADVIGPALAREGLERLDAKQGRDVWYLDPIIKTQLVELERLGITPAIEAANAYRTPDGVLTHDELSLSNLPSMHSDKVREAARLAMEIRRKIGTPAARDQTVTLKQESLVGYAKGYQDLYDVEFVSDTKKFVKRWGATVESIDTLDGSGMNEWHAVRITDKLREGLLEPIALYQQRDLFGLQPGRDIERDQREGELAKSAGRQDDMFGADLERQKRANAMAKGAAAKDDKLRGDKSIPADIGLKGDLFTTQKDLLDERQAPKSDQGSSVRQGVADLRIAERPGTNAEQRELRDDALAELEARIGGKRGASVVGAEISRDFKEAGHTELVGRVVRDVHDFAVLAQVYRDPRFEHLRVVFTKGGTVIDELHLSSRLAAAVTFEDQWFDTLKALFDRHAAAGADGWYMVHNHPAGDPTPSSADKSMTRDLARMKGLGGFLGHVVIDHDSYATIDGFGMHRIHKAPGLSEMTYGKGNPVLQHPLIGVKINDPIELGQQARQIERAENVVTLFGYTGNPNRIVGIVNVPLEQLRGARGIALIRRIKRHLGAAQMIAAGESNLSGLMGYVESGVLFEAIDLRLELPYPLGTYNKPDWFADEQTLTRRIEQGTMGGGNQRRARLRQQGDGEYSIVDLVSRLVNQTNGRAVMGWQGWARAISADLKGRPLDDPARAQLIRLRQELGNRDLMQLLERYERASWRDRVHVEDRLLGSIAKHFGEKHESIFDEEPGPGTVSANPVSFVYRRYQRAAQAVIDRWNEKIGWRWDALGKLPRKEDYLTARYATLGKLTRVREVGRDIYDTLADATPADATAIYDYLTTPGAVPAAIVDPVIRRKAVAVKKLIDRIGRTLVMRGMLSSQAYARYKDGYLPRIYLKHVLDEGQFSALGAGRRLSDLGYLRRRKNLGPDERILLGEILDPAFLASHGTVKPMRDLAIVDFLDALAGNADWVAPQSLVQWRGRRVSAFWLKREADSLRQRAELYGPQNKAFAQNVANQMDTAANAALASLANVSEDFKQLPDSPRYGILRGAWVRKEIHADLTGAMQAVPSDSPAVSRLFEYGGVGSRITQLWKQSKVAMNPPAQVRNFLSNMVLVHLSGVSMVRLPILYARAVNELRTHGKYWRIARKYGLFESTFTNTELLRIEEEWLDLQRRMGTSNPMATMKAMAGLLANKTSDLYQLSESIGKIAKLIDGMENDGLTESQAMIEAHKWLFDYSLVPKTVGYLRNAPIGVPFVTFYYKATARLGEALIKHPARFLPYIALGALMTAMLKDEWDIDDEEAEQLRQAMPNWIRERSHVWIMPWKDREGRWQVFDFGYLLPWAVHTEVLRSMSTGDLKKAAEVTGLANGPIPSLFVAWKTGIDPFSKREIFPANATKKEQLLALLDYTWTLAAPPFITSRGWLGKTIDAATGRVNPRTGDPGLVQWQAQLRLLGLNVYPVDPLEARLLNIRLFRREIEDVEQALGKRLRDRNLTPDEKAEIRTVYRAIIRQKQEDLQEYQKASAFPRRLMEPTPTTRQEPEA